MASTSKTTRKSSTTVTYAAAAARSPSPTRMNRLQEKAELSGLNDRLAAYIDKVRSLEIENNRLVLQVRTYEETSEREVSNVKALYEKELADARRILDDTAKDRAKLQIEANKYKQEAEEYSSKYNKRERDINTLEKRLQNIETELNDLRAKLADAQSQKQQAENEARRLRTEVANLEKQLATSRKQLEEETLARVDLENRLQTAQEELTLRSQIHEQQLNETRSRTEVSMQEFDTTMEKEYQTRLQDALREMRAQTEYDRQSYRVEIETMMETKISEMRNQAEKNAASADKYQEELTIIRRRVNDLNNSVSKLTAENDQLKRRNKDLEDQLSRERDDNVKIVEAYRIEIKDLRMAMENQMREYSDLMDIKIALDAEINAYRKLLECEEERLNISTSSESSPGRGRQTPVKSTPTRPGKRKRTEEPAGGLGSFLSRKSVDDYATQSSSKEDIVVKPFDVAKKCASITNEGEKDVSLAGWQVRHHAGSEETTFKFHRTVTLKAGQTVKVWSSETDATHSPPSDIVMKGQKWFTADCMKTILLNQKGEEVAHCAMSREQLRTSSSSVYKSSYSSGSIEGSLGRVGLSHRVYPQTDRSDRDKSCAVM